mmetsp:Transcript_42210/g.134029  ORF Transcript_42210/g.134029 Transcript_42210/m.134029 type:complete len:243 (-) Transcript_42210:1196-1924(-)
MECEAFRLIPHGHGIIKHRFGADLLWADAAVHRGRAGVEGQSHVGVREARTLPVNWDEASRAHDGNRQRALELRTRMRGLAGGPGIVDQKLTPNLPPRLCQVLLEHKPEPLVHWVGGIGLELDLDLDLANEDVIGLGGHARVVKDLEKKSTAIGKWVNRAACLLLHHLCSRQHVDLVPLLRVILLPHLLKVGTNDTDRQGQYTKTPDGGDARCDLAQVGCRVHVSVADSCGSNQSPPEGVRY